VRRRKSLDRDGARELRHDLWDIVCGHFLWDAAPTEIALCDFGIFSGKSAAADLAAP
jgi:hypothetical protein